MERPSFLIAAALLVLGGGLYLWNPTPGGIPAAHSGKSAKKQKKGGLPGHLKGVVTRKVKWKKKPKSYWKKVLTPLQYRVCRNGGTERPFTGAHLRNNKKGYFLCSSCGQVLFSSRTKFKSGTGWPSFYKAHKKGAIKYLRDTSYGMVRTEVKCKRCNAHLGHVFNDGPRPTGKRYCINSVCLLHSKKKLK